MRTRIVFTATFVALLFSATFLPPAYAQESPALTITTNPDEGSIPQRIRLPSDPESWKFTDQTTITVNGGDVTASIGAKAKNAFSGAGFSTFQTQVEYGPKWLPFSLYAGKGAKGDHADLMPRGTSGETDKVFGIRVRATW